MEESLQEKCKKVCEHVEQCTDQVEKIEAITCFLDSIENFVDPMSYELADIYYLYGTLLLADYTDKEILSQSTVDGNPNANDENAEKSDIQLAWEFLDIARVIYSKGKENEKNMQKTHTGLGDVLIENSLFEEAISEYHQAEYFWIKKTLPESLENGLEYIKTHRETLIQTVGNIGLRFMAEVYYKIGLCFEFLEKYNEAIAYTKLSETLLEQRRKYLEQVDSPSEIDLNEIKDIKLVIQELAHRVTDIQDASNTPVPEIRKEKKLPNKKHFSKKDVKNITSLVKRKKPNNGNETQEKKEQSGS